MGGSQSTHLFLLFVVVFEIVRNIARSDKISSLSLLCLEALTAEAAGQVHVLGHDRHAAAVDGT